MTRAILFVLDSFGIGGAPDAAAFGDAGANTYLSIIEAAKKGKADRVGLRSGMLRVPHMEGLGLVHAARLATVEARDALVPSVEPKGFWGAASEISRGKDTPSGHWEMAGVPVLFDWGYFPRTIPAFPASLLDAVALKAGISGTLGNCHASGTDIIAQFGAEHIRTGKPIFYTSVDSVLQIAAHETHFGLERLYDLCAIVRRLVDPLNIGRVIARPFNGEESVTFERTGNRRDYAVPPPTLTILDRLVAAGRKVFGIGKVDDIFAHLGISDYRKANGNMALFDASLAALNDAADGDLVFANFVDFDMLYGHRRDVAGYAAALEAFDRRLPELFAQMRAGDLLILTADHGCDPTWTGTDHTRECVPVIGFVKAEDKDVAPKAHCHAAHCIGQRETFADIGATIAAYLGLSPGHHGNSFLELPEVQPS